MTKPIWHYCVMTSNRGDKAIRKAIAQNIHKHLPEVPIAYFNCKFEELTEQRIEQLNKEASGLIIGGSGLYVERKSFSSGWYFPCKTELFDKIKVPIFLVGIGINQTLDNKFEKPVNNNSLKSIIKMNQLASLSSVRDSSAFSLLKDNGIKNVVLNLCPACFIKSPKINKINQVAINFSQHNPLLGRFDGTSDYRNKNLEIFGKIISYLSSQNYTVKFIAHDALEQSIINDLKKIQPNFSYINTDNIDTMLLEYAKSKFSIGVRLHSNILSFATDTPFISIVYDLKGIEFAHLVGADNFLTNIIDYDYLLLQKLVDEMIRNHQAIQTTLILHKDKYQNKSNKFFKQLTDEIL
jgi:polysaccharide pyruvyl transferase WcaK-like protein